MMSVATMPKRSRIPPECYTWGPVTSPGISVGRPRLERTGTSAVADITPWDISRLQRLLLEWLRLTQIHRVQTGGSSGSSVVPVCRETLPAPSSPSLSIQDQIAAIRGALSLQMKELAAVLKVQRPTVYAWTNGDSAPQPNNRVRLQNLWQIAREWNRLSRLPLGKEGLHTVHREDGRTIFDLLQQDPIPVHPLLSRMPSIAATLKRKETSTFSKRLRELAKRHKTNPDREKERQDLFDLETGKRINFE